jgi:hypothetical protein
MLAGLGAALESRLACGIASKGSSRRCAPFDAPRTIADEADQQVTQLACGIATKWLAGHGRVSLRPYARQPGRRI